MHVLYISSGENLMAILLISSISNFRSSDVVKFFALFQESGSENEIYFQFGNLTFCFLMDEIKLDFKFSRDEILTKRSNVLESEYLSI